MGGIIFCTLYYECSHCYSCWVWWFVDFFVDFKSFETLKQAGALFLQNRRFRFESKNRSKNHRNLGSKIHEHHLCQLKVNMLHFWSQKAIKMRSTILENQVRSGQLSSGHVFGHQADSPRLVWKGRGTKRYSRMCPPLTDIGRGAAAPRTPRVFFVASDNTGAVRTSAGRPPSGPPGRLPRP